MASREDPYPSFVSTCQEDSVDLGAEKDGLGWKTKRGLGVGLGGRKYCSWELRKE